MSNRVTEALAPLSPSLDLSLYQIDEGLSNLIEYRQERIFDKESPPDAEELAALDAEIARYAEALPSKVSGVCAMLRKWKAHREIAEAERKRLKMVVEHFEAMESNLKDICAAILEKMPEPKNGASRKLVGPDGAQLMLKRNGSVQPLVIQDPALLPDDCLTVSVKIPMDLWKEVVHLCPAQIIDRLIYIKEVHAPDTDAIRAKLAEPCPRCGGHPEDIVPMLPGETPGCDACANTGKNAVPGAYLAERGFHIEAR